MRLGDLDRIAQDIQKNNIGNYYKQDWTSSQVVTLLENAPTVNPVHAAGGCYCRECVKRGTCYCPMMNHYIGEDETEPDDFCSYGQRKEADHEVSE